MATHPTHSQSLFESASSFLQQRRDRGRPAAPSYAVPPSFRHIGFDLIRGIPTELAQLCFSTVQAANHINILLSN